MDRLVTFASLVAGFILMGAAIGHFGDETIAGAVIGGIIGIIYGCYYNLKVNHEHRI